MYVTGIPEVVFETENVPQAEPEQPGPLADQLAPFVSVVVAVIDSVWLTEIALRLGYTETLTMLVVTVKFTPLLARPPTVTTTLPVVAPAGTVTAMLVLLQVVAVAAVPLKVTVLLPCVAPKFVPVIVTGVPTAPEVGLRVATIIINHWGGRSLGVSGYNICATIKR